MWYNETPQQTFHWEKCWSGLSEATFWGVEGEADGIFGELAEASQPLCAGQRDGVLRGVSASDWGTDRGTELL